MTLRRPIIDVGEDGSALREPEGGWLSKGRKMAMRSYLCDEITFQFRPSASLLDVDVQLVGMRDSVEARSARGEE